jgi:hypothetical protein
MSKRDTDLGESFGNERDAAYDTVKAKQENSAKAKNVLRGAGYARGGGVGAKSMKPQSLHAEEPGDEKAIKTAKAKVKNKFASGGHVEGGKSKVRADKMARGGSKPRGHTKINISVGAGEQEKKQAMMQGAQLGARMMAQKMSGAPRPGAGAAPQARPMMPPPGGAPGGAPMPPPGPGGPPMAARGGRMYKDGGKVMDKKMTKGVPRLTAGAGAGGARGRLAKAKAYGGKPIK